MFAYELIYLSLREEQFRFKSIRFDERRTNQGTIKNILDFFFNLKEMYRLCNYYGYYLFLGRQLLTYLLWIPTWCVVSKTPGRGVANTYILCCWYRSHQIVCMSAVYLSDGFPSVLS
jgi:hypothetical protein